MNKMQEYVVWLQGFMDAIDKKPTQNQVKQIKEKLNSIFEHVAEPPKTEKEKKKEHLQDLGKKHNFPVYPTRPENNFFPNEDDEVLRC